VTPDCVRVTGGGGGGGGGHAVGGLVASGDVQGDKGGEGWEVLYYYKSTNTEAFTGTKVQILSHACKVRAGRCSVYLLY
jgi:hypothetical protein